MDSVVGKVMDSLDKDTTLIILSDHGFSAFRRVVHLNSWLEQNGYLVLKQGERPSDLLFENVDWDRTRAYALGLSGIYVNQRGREAHGIVAPGQETDDLLCEIVGKLEAVTDPASGARAVSKVYRGSEVYHGPRAAAAPDLVVGFFPGWRVSWQTALGGVPGQVFDDNARWWNADHIFDAAHIPGILLMNRKIAAAHPRIIDIAPTILKLLHLRIPDEMDGTPLLQE
jgi:predicted AlkP superfamily phosphohydrolase/phosphomutase